MVVGEGELEEELEGGLDKVVSSTEPCGETDTPSGSPKEGGGTSFFR